MKKVIDVTEYMPRGGWISTNTPFIFNINDVKDIQKKIFEFENEEPSYVIRLEFLHGDSISLVYPDEEARDEAYNTVTLYKKKSRLKVLNGKPGK